MGAFITFEGSEGCGKTTQLAALADFLRAQGYSVVATREPGGTAIGDQVRCILSDLKNTAMQPRTELLLFQASRAQLVEEVILPHLRLGGIVLSDRYADSTLAYQVYGYQKLDVNQARLIVEFATGGLKPDLTLLLDIDVEEGLRRRAEGGEWNRLDAYDLAFYQRVREGYLELVRQEPQRWVVINAGQPLECVQAEIRQEVMKRLKLMT
jgi:dTMP kinase